MEFTFEATEQGVTERRFELEVSGQTISGTLYAPEGANGSRPAILMAHDSSEHKDVDSQARAYVRRQRWVVIAMGAPSEDGGQSMPGPRAPEWSNLGRRTDYGSRVGNRGLGQQMAQRIVRAISELRATLDAFQAVAEVSGGPIGYFGVSGGTAAGVPFLAAEPRVQCAVLGLYGLGPGQNDFARAAERVNIPLLFAFQRNDESVNLRAGMYLFDAFGSKEKTMHVNLGGRADIPTYEYEDFERFFVRHLRAGA